MVLEQTMRPVLVQELKTPHIKYTLWWFFLCEEYVQVIFNPKPPALVLIKNTLLFALVIIVVVSDTYKFVRISVKIINY